MVTATAPMDSYDDDPCNDDHIDDDDHPQEN